MFKKILIFSFALLLSYNFVFAEGMSLPENMNDLNNLQENLLTEEMQEQGLVSILKELNENVIPFVKNVFAWGKENVWPILEELIDETMTPEREEELNRETEEFKEDLPNFIEKINSIIEQIREK